MSSSDRSHPSQGEFTLQFADAHVATAIDVDSVPVGVDLHIIDRQVVDPRRQMAKCPHASIERSRTMTLPAVLEGDRLVADAWGLFHRKIGIVMPAASPRPQMRPGPSTATS